ncbi:MAG: hypothetical protein JWO54_989 [Candidatus Saccharibacteria bacterium]|nr:hypothetical protein [Candidatus Saccharibacteria bacterium]MDB5181226.1 hypothetical protein [Candidatus Saccharibacteria bacterium]
MALFSGKGRARIKAKPAATSTVLKREQKERRKEIDKIFDNYIPVALHIVDGKHDRDEADCSYAIYVAVWQPESPLRLTHYSEPAIGEAKMSTDITYFQKRLQAVREKETGWNFEVIDLPNEAGIPSKIIVTRSTTQN